MGSGMQFPSLPAKSFNRFGRMKTPLTQGCSKLPSPGTRAKQRWEGKAATLRNVEGSANHFSCERTPRGTSSLHVGLSDQHVVRPRLGVPTDSASGSKLAK